MSRNARVSVVRDGPVLVAILAGSWRLREGLPALTEVTHALGDAPHP